MNKCIKKTEIVGFLSFCNIHSEISSTIRELRNLIKSAVKSFRNDEDLEDSLNKTDLTFTDINLQINLKSEQTLANVTVVQDDTMIDNFEIENIDTISITRKLQNHFDELHTSNKVDDAPINLNNTKYIQNLEVGKILERVNQKLNNDLTTEIINLNAKIHINILSE